MRPGAPRTIRVRAFSMVEVLVVLVLLAVLAGLIVPRFGSTASRRGQLEVEEFARVLSAAAIREQLTSQRLAISFEPSTATAALYRLDTSETGRGTEWTEDALAGRATLHDVVFRRVESDGQELDPARWRVEFRRSEPRPSLRFVLATPDDKASWGVVLSPAASRAMIVDPARLDAESDVVDLDKKSGGGTPWS